MLTRLNTLTTTVNLLQQTKDAMDLSQQNATREATINTDTTPVFPPAFSSSVSATLADLPLSNTTQDATIAGRLMVVGRTTLTDVGITGSMLDGLLSFDGLNGALNTLSGPLYLESQGLNGIDMFHGKILFSPTGDISTKGTVTASKLDINETNLLSSSIGDTTLPKGETSLVIHSTMVTNNSHIFISPETVITEPIVVVSKQNGAFTIEVNSAIDKDVKFSWWVIN